MATSYNDYLEKKKQSKKKTSQNETQKKIIKNNSFINLLDENDIKLSKPITIDALINERKRCKIKLFYIFI